MDGLEPCEYQLVPLTKLLLNGQDCVLVCDGVGVGKTVSAGYIASFLTSLTRRNALVICPPTLQEKWRLELRSKFGLHVIPLRSEEEFGLASDGWNEKTADQSVYVAPSSLLTRQSLPAFMGPIVIDEIHNYRNNETKSWEALSKVSAPASHRIGLSATPINNRLADLSAELAILLAKEFHVVDAVVNDLWRPEKRQILFPLLTRFTKERLGVHFAARRIADKRVVYPASYISEVQLAIKNRRMRPITDTAYRDEITYFRLAASSPEAFERSVGVRTSRPTEKMEQLLQILQKHGTERVIVFVVFSETAKEVARSVSDRDAFVITGEVPVFEREDRLADFKTSRNGLLVMTSVGTEGLDLQFCSTLVNYDLTWNPMVLEQRIGRVDRIGQTKPAIHVYNFVVEGSIDERILHSLGRKLGLVSGSLLEPSSILGSEGTSGSVGMFGENALEQETESAKSLARALELSRTILPEDYAVLGSIDRGFCRPEAIRQLAADGAGPAWLAQDASSEAWRHTFTSGATAFREVLGYYA